MRRTVAWARLATGAMVAGLLLAGCHPPGPTVMAPAFTLPLLRGTSVPGLPELAATQLTYPGGTGPYLFIFTDINTDSERVRYDSLAYGDARALKVPIWTLLLHADQGTGLSFAFHSADRSERFLLDDGTVTTAYHAGQASCWVVVDRRGAVVWQGPADLGAAHRAMTEATR